MIEVGSSWRLVGAFPGDGAPQPGVTVRVRDVVPADEPGANAFSDGAQPVLKALRDRQRGELASADDPAETAVRHGKEYDAAAAPFQVDAVVVEWSEPVAVWDGEGYVTGSRVRAWSLSAEQLAEHFEEA